MSWDLIVFASDTPIDADEDGIAILPDDFEPRAIGTRSHVQEKISNVFPETTWSDPAWGVLDAVGYSFEFSLGSNKDLTTFTIHARGNATPAAMRLIEATGWRILETSGGKWLNDSADPDEGRRDFQAYLDQVVKEVPTPDKRGWFSRLFGR